MATEADRSATGAGEGAAGESIFIADGGRFVPTEQARGPWDPRAVQAR